MKTPTETTTGKWSPIVRGKGTEYAEVVAFLEVFSDGEGRFFSIPGASRVIEVSHV